MYTDDYDGKFNGGYAGPGNPGKSNWWMDSGREYMDNVDKLRCCPTANKPRKLESGADGPGLGREPFAAWTFNSVNDDYDYGSYGTNGWTEDKPEGWGSLPPENFWRKMPNIPNGARVPMILDAQWLDGWPDSSANPPSSPNAQWWVETSHFVRFIQDRHNKKQNVAFADGTVVTVGLKELWTLRWHREYKIGGPWTQAGGATPAKWKASAEWMSGYKDY